MFVFLTLTTPTHAQMGERLENRADRIETRQASMAANREERQENRQERRSDIAGKHADRLEERFANYYSRLSMIITRMLAHLETIDPTKKDTTLAKAKIAEAKLKLEEAKTLGATAVSLFRSIDPAKWSEQKTQALAARDTANQAREAFKATHALMVEAVKSLKSLNAK